jgi:hypothetical protein
MSMKLDRTLLACALVVSCATVQPQTARVTPVEVWRVGDDGLTIRFSEALEEAFGRSPSFTLVRGKQPTSLIVTIAGHVSAEDVGQSVQVRYTVAYSDVAGKSLGKVEGRCWEERLTVCAAKVVDEAANAAQRMTDTR